MNYKLLILYIFLAQTLFCFSQENSDTLLKEPTEEELNWLRTQIYPIETFDPADENNKDLDVLGELIGDSKIVALGENTHDSREIFNIKHRIIKYLVKNHNFDFFALEGNMPESKKFNNFINHGQGEPLEYIKGLHYKWIWRNQEFIDLLEWMKKYNQGSSKIIFTGVDMQYYQGPIQELETVFNKNKDLLPQILKLKALLSKMDNTILLPKESKISSRDIRTSNRHLSRIKKAASRLPHQNERELTLQNVRLLEQYISNKNQPYWNSRDSFMAENLIWITEQNPRSKILVWAHNEHVKKTNRRMGDFLSTHFGNDYINVGFAFGRGTYTGIDLEKMELNIYNADKPGKDTYEYYFDKIGSNSFILDLKTIRENKPEVANWLLENHLFRRIGSIKPHQEFQETNLSKDFDLIIYVNETTATKILD